MRGGPTRPHRPRLVASHSTRPLSSLSLPAHSFYIGPAVINIIERALMTLSTPAIRPQIGDASPVLDRDVMRTAKDDILPDHISTSDLGTSHLFSASDATTRENMMTCWSVKPPHAPRQHTSTATLSGALQRWKTGKATWASGLATSALGTSSLLLLTDRARCPVHI